MTLAEWRGPLPPPDVIAAYNDIIPNGAERLFRQFEIEASERRAANRRQQRYKLYDMLAGRGSALVFALAALGVAAFAVYKDMPVAAGIIGGTSLVVGIGYLMRVASGGLPRPTRPRPPANQGPDE